MTRSLACSFLELDYQVTPEKRHTHTQNKQVCMHLIIIMVIKCLTPWTKLGSGRHAYMKSPKHAIKSILQSHLCLLTVISHLVGMKRCANRVYMPAWPILCPFQEVFQLVVHPLLDVTQPPLFSVFLVDGLPPIILGRPSILVGSIAGLMFCSVCSLRKIQDRTGNSKSTLFAIFFPLEWAKGVWGRFYTGPEQIQYGMCLDATYLVLSLGLIH